MAGARRIGRAKPLSSVGSGRTSRSCALTPCDWSWRGGGVGGVYCGEVFWKAVHHPVTAMKDPYVRRVGYFWKFHWQSIRRSRITPVPDLPHRHRSEVRMSYQITFKDNCICLE